MIWCIAFFIYYSWGVIATTQGLYELHGNRLYLMDLILIPIFAFVTPFAVIGEYIRTMVIFERK